MAGPKCAPCGADASAAPPPASSPAVASAPAPTPRRATSSAMRRQTAASECADDCTTSSPLCNRRSDSGRPSFANSFRLSSRSSGDTSSVPRARLYRQYTSGSVRMPPDAASGFSKKSASCRDSSTAYRLPADSCAATQGRGGAG
eukprot:316435-Chlamydomonas_euryale.AAC.1